MGGNALKNTVTRRYNKDEYDDICDDVIGKLTSVPNGWSRISIIPAYREKETFGDMDVLVDYPFSVNSLTEVFNPNEIIKNGDVISFDYKQFQIDVIYSKPNAYEYAHSYFSYNDLGNLIGKLAHKFGLKHGHAGLILPLRNADHKFEDIIVTLHHDETLKFLGLDPSKFHAGFDNLQQVFEYVSSSEYFNPDSYLLENLNHIARTRDKKRATYNEFLKYCDNWTGTKFVGNADKSTYLEHIFTTFPAANVQFKNAVHKLAFQQFVSQKFNGAFVSEVTGLTSKRLGQFMARIKTKFNFSDHVIVMTPVERLRELLLTELKEFESEET